MAVLTQLCNFFVGLSVIIIESTQHYVGDEMYSARVLKMYTRKLLTEQFCGCKFLFCQSPVDLTGGTPTTTKIEDNFQVVRKTSI